MSRVGGAVSLSQPDRSATPPAPDLQAVLDGQRIGRYQLLVLAVIFALTWADGVDLQVSSFAAADIAREWGIAKADLAPFLSAGLFGLLLGSPALGWVGDRVGRKPALLLSCGALAAVSVLCAAAASLTMLISVRVAAGFFIGGLLPNLIALAVEIAPARRRGLYVVLAATGVGLGATCTAWLMTALPALHHWRTLFLFSAAAPAVGGLLAAALLPESPAILARRTGEAQALLRLLGRLRPDLVLAAVPPLGTAAVRADLSALFRNQMAPVTAALWLLVALVFLTSYLVTSWTPVLMHGAGLSEADAGRAVAFLHAGGTLGALAAAVVIDRFGWSVIAAYVLIAMAGAAGVGSALGGPALLPWLLAVLGFGVIGAQCGLNAAAGLTYPANVRARGTGLVFAASRIGSIGGPFLGGALLAAGLGGPGLYAATLGPLAAALLVTLLIAAARGRVFGAGGPPIA